MPTSNEENGDKNYKAFRSIDGKYYKIQTSDVVAFAPGLARLAEEPIPGTLAESRTTIVEEYGFVLDVVFSFMKRERHPNLEQITNIEMLIDVANAVFKYEVFSGMNTCLARMRALMPHYPLFVFCFAADHKQTKLLDEAATYLCSSEYSFGSLAVRVSKDLLLPLVELQKVWSEKFQPIVEFISKFPLCVEKECHGVERDLEAENPIKICNGCKADLYGWICVLDQMADIGKMKESLRLAGRKDLKLPCFTFISSVPAQLTALIAAKCLDIIDNELPTFDFVRREIAMLVDSD
ncbi:hypothetical protein JR316_0009340 [Psilocybe cubensis]|uniref:Uncharacterized protein n=2 Tax=Psilocybe cubensis TaxID=181762 RepID=A0ACB8GT24_PSICU|nr:hypothetical protein JR316_0009340 [Psilocybe cubensis]KAH9478878.1 hypothetical protein JR316_0009340 [Psilocybe cubensis]